MKIVFVDTSKEILRAMFKTDFQVMKGMLSFGR